MNLNWGLILGLTFTGLFVVFLALIILIVLITLMGKIATSKGEKKPQPPIEPQPKTAPAPVVESGISGETVAVISAAVAAMLGSNQSVAIKSIKRSKNSRSAWNMAGVSENTKPF